MGGGGLRILKHKKWHVWTRENIEKVRRDERLHEEAERTAFREKRKRDLDGRVEALKKTKPTPPAIDLFAPDEIAPPPPVASNKKYPDEGIALGGALNPAHRHVGRHKPPSQPWYLQQSQGDDDAAEAPRAAFADPMAAIVGRPKTFMAATDDTREADALDFAGDTVVTTRTELKKTKKKAKKAKSSSSSRFEQLRRERTEREAAEQRRLATLLRR
ncbi:hypothetical protein SPRG_15413 [Saprolegnia parasitica CBS 223.65]|uniref:CBF1-interacting co-repressor CIR N-terminal domain-containing protein n=1 Tax=Saprolegnia parasitica (strain CBS 223.65) TaxID=695850 RepID=A0A067BMI3_SAPPC|nr:hypothetical protein SPRG_15413 [Saprolegnia parasitica CBS 223.65]KDO19423.1 hypothetical protein SPRG_15413 [Saprolegnia parasitica CBS 223.65]|eukprot:XP_012209849.1 hypothetical protein SPRG_15413 [Saprolegnia parasitica CBS 223.65]